MMHLERITPAYVNEISSVVLKHIFSIQFMMTEILKGRLKISFFFLTEIILAFELSESYAEPVLNSLLL